MDAVAALLILGAAQGILLAFVLLNRKHGNRDANRILAAILVIFSLSILIHTLSHATDAIQLPLHQELIQILFFLFGPFIFLYVKALTTANYQSQKKDTLHVIPCIVAFAVYMPFYLLTMSKGGFTGDEATLLGKILSWVLIAHVVVYLSLSVRALMAHSKVIRNSFSSISKINLNWLKFFLSGFVLLWIVALYLEIVQSDSNAINFMWLLVSFFIYVIGYLGLWQPEIFSGVEYVQADAVAKKYERSSLTEENAEKHLDQLRHFMTAEKPFLDSDISLYGLAKKLSMPPHHLSQIINEKLGQNFFEFINEYRVNEAKMRLNDPQNDHLTIAAIGFDSGFNSISAFNSAFKKHSGMNPSQFRTSPRQ